MFHKQNRCSSKSDSTLHLKVLLKKSTLIHCCKKISVALILDGKLLCTKSTAKPGFTNNWFSFQVEHVPVLTAATSYCALLVGLIFKL